MSALESQLIIRDLSVTREGRQLLKPLSFSLPRGKWLSIVGPNGAGKSTLLKALAGIIEACSGEIQWGNVRIDRLPQRHRACHIAYVPQRFDALLPFSIEQFLSLALYAENSPSGAAQVARAIELFRLEGLRRRSIQQVSVGELQRVMLAAAFVQGSELLLLDEPSSALDPYEEAQFVQILRELIKTQGRTVVCVSHNLSAALSFADMVVVLDSGASSFQGDPDTLIESGVLQRVFRQNFFIDRRGQQLHVLPDYSQCASSADGVEQ